jgi:Tol biopolymer transport system component
MKTQLIRWLRTSSIQCLAAASIVFLGCGGGDDGGTGPSDTLEPGDLEITMSTTGTELDADGYTLSLDGGAPQTVASDGTVVFTSLSAGSHTLTIDGFALNCDPEGGSTQSVSVPSGGTGQVTLVVSCTRKELVFQSDREPGCAPGAPSCVHQIFRMNPDGSGQRQITSAPSGADGIWKGNFHPQWSPDGSKIAFASDRDGECSADPTVSGRGCSEIYVMNADGSGQTRVTTAESFSFSPSWSPDGQSLVFTSATGTETIPGGGGGERTVIVFHLFTIGLDGTGLTQLTTAADKLGECHLEMNLRPDWGPDGRIAYSSCRAPEDSSSRIWVMNADGSNATQLTFAAESWEANPAWSPDGATLVFEKFSVNGLQLYTMPSAGGEQTRRTAAGAEEALGRWSPDGSQLTFTTILSQDEVCIGSSAASGATNLSSNPARDGYSDWRPAA